MLTYGRFPTMQRKKNCSFRCSVSLWPSPPVSRKMLLSTCNMLKLSNPLPLEVKSQRHHLLTCSAYQQTLGNCNKGSQIVQLIRLNRPFHMKAFIMIKSVFQLLNIGTDSAMACVSTCIFTMTSTTANVCIGRYHNDFTYYSWFKWKNLRISVNNEVWKSQCWKPR